MSGNGCYEVTIDCNLGIVDLDKKGNQTSTCVTREPRVETVPWTLSKIDLVVNFRKRSEPGSSLEEEDVPERLVCWEYPGTQEI